MFVRFLSTPFIKIRTDSHGTLNFSQSEIYDDLLESVETEFDITVVDEAGNISEPATITVTGVNSNLRTGPAFVIEGDLVSGATLSVRKVKEDPQGAGNIRNLLGGRLLSKC